MSTTEPNEEFAPPRDGIRALYDEPVTFTRSDDGHGLGVMSGHFALFGEWAEIDSSYEGHFMEQVAPGAFRKTMLEGLGRMKVLFHHGRDPAVGLRVLGTPILLEEDGEGAYYEVALHDTSYNRDLIPGLEAGDYGASFRFRTLRDNKVMRPGKSVHNPRGIPERTLLELAVPEFGPTPFPAYAGATSGMRFGMRSLSDEFLADPARAGRIVIPLARGGQVDRVTKRDRRYERAVSYISGAVWALRPEMLETVMEIVGERANGNTLTDEQIKERIGERTAPPDVPADSAVRVINITGSIVPHGPLFENTSGAGTTSIEGLSEAFKQALADPSVASILFNVDSPGGSSELIQEFAQEIYDARGQKPVVAVANTEAASAAYWIACQADELCVTPSGDVGSIGVWTTHTDISVAQEKAGIKTTVIKAGKYKFERNPFGPLSEETAAYMQESVDETYVTFIDAVAQARGVDAATVKADFGQGRVVSADAAVKAGMADRVATFTQVLAEMQHKAAGSARSKTAPPTDAGNDHLRLGRRGSTHLGKKKEAPSWRL